MIAFIQGTLAEATPLHAIVEIGGFGYEVNIPVTTAEKLPAPGAKVKLHTLVIYREDAQTLYGFATAAERDFFRLMIEHVTGIGPKSALTIMSKLSLAVLESTIRSGDVGTLSKCPGIGKKTAERLVVELKGKVGGGVRGLQRLQAVPATARLGDEPWRGHCRGTDVRLGFEADAFAGGSPLLLGSVLAHFFALYTTANSFVRLAVMRGDEVWMQWPARSGRQALL